ncbi:unnamed protein product [Ambrosiozyma monospora]|uniref:Unnamed protein product n=1 Tax=Ambrosiozyma monospora TaxID=43982 RepID=A0ACB5TMV1_AMBMO|nr:unnamed protein product [Ambrosiozyma monospora]
MLTKTPFGKYLHIKTVNPRKSQSEMHRFMSFTARQYLDNKNLNTFVSTRRLPGSSSVTNLWTEEVTYETQLTFPTLMNRSEIKYVHTIKLSPIKNAVKALIEKNEELSGLEFLIKQNLREGIDPKTIASGPVFGNLSRILAGTVDSPVNGGVGQYRAFFNMKSSGYSSTGSNSGTNSMNDSDVNTANVSGGPIDPRSQEDDDFEMHVKYLRTSFNNLIILLNKLLKLHHALVPSNLKTQHQVMVELFSKNFKTEIKELELDVKSTLNLDKLLKSLISTNIYSKRYQREHGLITGIGGGISHDGSSSGLFSSEHGGGSSSWLNDDDSNSTTSGLSGPGSASVV